MIRTRKIAGLALALSVAIAGPWVHATEVAGDAAAGKRLYELAQLADGSPLHGVRANGIDASGALVACVACHRASGMGQVEGDIQVPPITGNALFGTGDKVIATMDPRSGKAFNRSHPAWSGTEVAAMLRTGTRPDGSAMNVLMPRYELGATDWRNLQAYLQQLSSEWSPGVTADEIHFATVITPDVPAARRALFRDMVQKIVAQKNGSTKVAGTGGTRHHMTSAAELVLGTERRWSIDFWELQGPPSGWAAQLDAHYRAHPVFALLSGLGGDDWAPIDAFCDREALPCWFPSVAAPPMAEHRYSLYFSPGVSLEAAVLAERLRARGHAPEHLLLVRRDDEAGRLAGRAVVAALAGSRTGMQELVIGSVDDAALAARLAKLDRDDDVAFWLPAADVSALAKLPAPRAATWFSGVLGGAELAPVPVSWRANAHLLYPWELPARRAANLAYFKAWLNQRRLPETDEIMQSEVYFSFAFMTDTVSELLDNLYRDYLIERAEAMINRREGGRAESEYYSSTASHVRTHAAAEPASLRALRLAGTAFGRRSGTSAYPRLTLGAGQRFASKGAYVLGFAADGSLQPDGDWQIPH